MRREVGGEREREREGEREKGERERGRERVRPLILTAFQSKGHFQSPKVTYQQLQHQSQLSCAPFSVVGGPVTEQRWLSNEKRRHHLLTYKGVWKNSSPF